MTPSLPPSYSSEDLSSIALSLPLWQISYLVSLQVGDSPYESARKSKVSVTIVKDALKSSSAFARCVTAVMAGVAIMGVPHARKQAEAQSPRLVEHFADKALTAKHDRDQIAAGRVVLDVAGAFPQHASPAVAAVQVNLAAIGYDDWVREQQERQKPQKALEDDGKKAEKDEGSQP